MFAARYFYIESMASSCYKNTWYSVPKGATPSHFSHVSRNTLETD